MNDPTYTRDSNTDTQLHLIKPNVENMDEILEMSDDFNLSEFQVVRREFFAHLRDPAVTFNNRKFYVNTACLMKFPNVDYVQALVNPESQILALRPCSESTRGAFLWCINSKGKRKPKQTVCTLFFAKIFTLMNWNPDYRYKLLGNVIHANGEYLIAFDLNSTEVYEKIYDEDDKPKASRKPVYPAGWQDYFGMPFHEHRQSMLINIFDGYAIYSIKDNTAIKSTSNNNAVTEETVPALTTSQSDEKGVWYE